MIGKLWRGEDVSFVRWGVREPTARERWRLYVAGLDDESCAAAGLNVIGPALDLSPLSGHERARLAYLASLVDREKTAEQAAEWAGLLSRLPRWTAPGYDVDVAEAVKGTPAGARAASRVCALIMDEELRRGNTLRVSYSSGGPGGGIHLEFGACADSTVARPDLLRVMFRRAEVVLSAAGLVPWSATQWTLASLADEAARLNAKPEVVVDLAPLNHEASNRQRLFRPLGGRTKNGKARKTLATPVREGSLITHHVLAEAPPETPRETERKRSTHAHREREPIVLTGAGPLHSWLSRFERRGDNHSLRMALCGMAQRSKIGTAETWIKAIGHALGDMADARACWASTASRLASDQPTLGLAYVRDHLGSWAMLELASVVSDTTGRPLLDVHVRLGSPVATDVAPAVADALAAARSPDDDEHDDLVERVRDRARHCRRIKHRCTCDLCGQTRYEGRMTCGVRELCFPCLHQRTRTVVEWLSSRWTHTRIALVSVDGTDPDALHEAFARSQREVPRGKRALAIVYPLVAGWRMLMVAPQHTLGEAHARGLHGTKARVCGKDEALRAVTTALLARGVAVRDLAERGSPEQAAALMIALYHRHEAYGVKSAALAWPSAADLKAHVRQNMAEDASACACPTPGVHDYSDSFSGAKLIEGARFPADFRTAVRALKLAMRTGRVPPDPIPRRRAPARFPLRT